MYITLVFSLRPCSPNNRFTFFKELALRLILSLSENVDLDIFPKSQSETFLKCHPIRPKMEAVPGVRSFEVPLAPDRTHQKSKNYILCQIHSQTSKKHVGFGKRKPSKNLFKPPKLIVFTFRLVIWTFTNTSYCSYI